MKSLQSRFPRERTCNEKQDYRYRRTTNAHFLKNKLNFLLKASQRTPEHQNPINETS